MSEMEIESGTPSGAADSPRSEQVDPTPPSLRCSLDCDCSFDFEASWDDIQGLPEPIYDHYRQNNVYPPVQEEKIIKFNIAQASAQISLITTKVNWLGELMTFLTEEKERIEQIVSESRSVLRPIQKLPLELLTKVFLFAVDAPGVSASQGFRVQLPPTSLNPSKEPWVLSQICRSWRKTALNTPGLWTNVSFAFPSDSAGGQSMDVLLTQCHRLQLQLQRSAKHPIDVHTKTPDPATTSLERFLSPLCAYSPSWRHLRIELDGDIFRPWISCISGRLQSLESLERVEMPPGEFYIVIAPLTSLYDLSFGVAQVGGISDDYLSLFNQKNPATSRFSLIPKLESLSLLPVGDFASTYTFDALIDVLEARCRVSVESADDGLNDVATPADSRLMSVQLDKGIDDGRLDQLRIEGLRVGLWGEN
ncbi:hypothetical protein PQX77_007339 [Marasmius sp. AFHP31]|nr:hypothetical protein PQX77_007339 [Marasmius sp. AFHP31]